jgi:S-adenosylmethionine decarboxylase
MRKIHGWHLLMDGFVTRTASLGAENLRRTADALIQNLNMRYLGEPTFRVVDLDPKKLDSEEDEGGFTFIAPITTSHIAIHCWPLRKAFMMDIFSCREFNMEQAVTVACAQLDVRRYEVSFIHRKGPAVPVD